MHMKSSKQPLPPALKKYWTLLTLLFILVSACAGKAPQIAVPDHPPATHFNSKLNPSVALVLGAGGARGYAHLGVLAALEAAHIPIDLVAGASVGSFVGALYTDSLSAQQAYDHMMSATFWDLADISNLPSTSGIISGYHFEKFLLKHLRAKHFKSLKKPLIVTTTDLTTGTSYLITSGPIAPAVLASAALPGAVKPVFLYGKTLIDGGVTQPIPVSTVLPYHPKVIIAVDISPELAPTAPHFALSIYNRAYDIMWQQLNQHSAAGADILIRPKVGQINTFNMNEKDALYEAGIKATQAQLPALRALLKQKKIPLKK